MTLGPFESLAAFRAFCGEPTMPLEHCATCRAIPEPCDYRHITSFVSEDDYGHNNIPDEVRQLEIFVDGLPDNALMRCPNCRRVYHYEHEIADDGIGVRTTTTVSYRRVDAAAVFRTKWCISRRLPGREPALHYGEFFPHHSLVQLDKSPGWWSLDETNQLVRLTPDTLLQLIAKDPPTRLDDLDRASSYAWFVSLVEDPELVVLYDTRIRWRAELTTDERDQIASALAASRIEEPKAERVDDRVSVRLWMIAKRRLICRIASVHPTGTVVCEDAVIAENLPVA